MTTDDRQTLKALGIKVVRVGKLVNYFMRNDRGDTVTIWYDFHTREWVVYLVDLGGNQIGDSVRERTFALAVKMSRVMLENVSEYTYDRLVPFVERGLINDGPTLKCSVCGREFVVRPYDDGRFLAHETMCMRRKVVANVVENVIDDELGYAGDDLSIVAVSDRAYRILVESYDDLSEMTVVKEVRKQLSARKAEKSHVTQHSYHVYALDSWGDPGVGYEVNDRRRIGKVDLADDASDFAIRRALIVAGFLTKGCRMSDITIEWHDDDMLSIDEAETGMPLLSIERFVRERVEVSR